MRLMLSSGSSLPFKTFHIEDVSRLKARQKISCSSKHLETERNSVRIVIGIGFFRSQLSKLEYVPDPYWVIFYRAFCLINLDD